jgi:Secretory lipase
MSGAPLDATANRVLYRSRGLNDEPIAVSGVVIIPAGPTPPGGRPIIAWAHPTPGVVPDCAPSLAIFFFQQVQGLREMIRRGYIVTATDYPGLGTAGPHPYLVGISEGRAVLDSVRGALNLANALSRRPSRPLCSHHRKKLCP